MRLSAAAAGAIFSFFCSLLPLSSIFHLAKCTHCNKEAPSSIMSVFFLFQAFRNIAASPCLRTYVYFQEAFLPLQPPGRLISFFREETACFNCFFILNRAGSTYNHQRAKNVLAPIYYRYLIKQLISIRNLCRVPCILQCYFSSPSASFIG